MFSNFDIIVGPKNFIPRNLMLGLIKFINIKFIIQYVYKSTQHNIFVLLLSK